MDLCNGLGQLQQQRHASIIQPLRQALQFGLLRQALRADCLPARRSAEQFVGIDAEDADQRSSGREAGGVDLTLYGADGVHRCTDGFREGHLAQFAVFPGCPDGGSELLFYFSHALA